MAFVQPGRYGWVGLGQDTGPTYVTVGGPHVCRDGKHFLRAEDTGELWEVRGWPASDYWTCARQPQAAVIEAEWVAPNTLRFRGQIRDADGLDEARARMGRDKYPTIIRGVPIKAERVAPHQDVGGEAEPEWALDRPEYTPDQPHETGGTVPIEWEKMDEPVDRPSTTEDPRSSMTAAEIEALEAEAAERGETIWETLARRFGLDGEPDGGAARAGGGGLIFLGILVGGLLWAGRIRNDLR